MKKFKLSLLLAALSIYQVNFYAKNIIVDLGFTMIDQSTSERLNATGYKIILFALLHPSTASSLIRDTLYDIYVCAGNKLNLTADGAPDGQLDYKGSKMPRLLQHYLLGKITLDDPRVQSAIGQCLDSYDRYAFPASLHKELVRNIIHWVEDPQFYARSWVANKTMLRLLKELAKVKDAQGQQKHTFFILSDFDSETYKELTKRSSLQRVFKFFKPENRYISGLRHDIKPNKSFFKMLLDENNLSPSKTVFIDDEMQNIKVAEELGINAIFFNRKAGNNYKRIHGKLRNLGYFDGASQKTQKNYKKVI